MCKAFFCACLLAWTWWQRMGVCRTVLPSLLGAGG
jgi:hypothetical protein